MNGRILVVDDNRNVLAALKQLLEPEFAKVICIASPTLIPGILDTQEIDLVLMDMNFRPGESDGREGMEWLKRIIHGDPDAVVVMFTAYSELSLAIASMKCGAIDFVAKPWDNDKLLATLRSGVMLSLSRRRIHQLQSKQEQLHAVLESEREKLLGRSACIGQVRETVRKVAPTDSNILILGENGTGKEVIAREIHHHSHRAGEVFVHVDLGAISGSLFESELFGHVKGAFTDAKSDKAGRIEVASGGTLFLDEIGNLLPEMQTRLLNVLQNREIYRVGSNRPIRADFRLITATNQDPAEMIMDKRFREDLYYRINTIEITAPPLRDRGEDVVELGLFFLERYKRKHGRPRVSFAKESVELLRSYLWPGNVRQLQHSVERAVLLADGMHIRPGDILPGQEHDSGNYGIHRPTLAEVEQAAILEAIHRNVGNLSRAARELGVARSTLYNKLRYYDKTSSNG